MIVCFWSSVNLLLHCCYRLLSAIFWNCYRCISPLYCFLVLYTFCSWTTANAFLYFIWHWISMSFFFCLRYWVSFVVAFQLFISSQILQNFEDILRKSQFQLQDQSKLESILAGLVHCLTLLPSNKQDDDSSIENVPSTFDASSSWLFPICNSVLFCSVLFCFVLFFILVFCFYYYFFFFLRRHTSGVSSLPTFSISKRAWND